MAVVIYPRCNERVAHLRGVKAAVYAEAKAIEYRAKASWTEHRQEGNSRIVLERSGTDAWVSLEGPGDQRFNNAVAIEFGHFHNLPGEYIPGLYIISAAAGFLTKGVFV